MSILNSTPILKNGDVLDAQIIINTCDTAISATNIANSAKAASEQASADVVRLEKVTVEKLGTIVYANGALQPQMDVVQAPGSSTLNVMSQKSTTDSLVKRVMNVAANGNYLQISKEIADGTIHSTNVTVPYATKAANADFAASATNASFATSATSASTATTSIKLNGGNVIIDQTGLTSLVSGKTYINCSFAGDITISNGTCYFYNCSTSSGSIYVASASAKLFINSSPHLSVACNFMGTLIQNGMALLYDKDSNVSSLNWGYPSGIKVANGNIYKDFSRYRHVIVSGTLASGTTGIILVGSNTTLLGQSSGKYIGRLTVWVSQDHIAVSDAREWFSGLGSPTSIEDFDMNHAYFISKVYGVL